MENFEEKIADITKRTDLAFRALYGVWDSIDMERGWAQAKPLLTVEGEVSVAYTRAKAGSIFGLHSHKNVRECIQLTTKGAIVRIEMDGATHTIEYGIPFCVNENVEHRVICQTDANFVVSTIPNNPSWPEK